MYDVSGRFTILYIQYYITYTSQGKERTVHRIKTPHPTHTMAQYAAGSMERFASIDTVQRCTQVHGEE